MSIPTAARSRPQSFRGLWPGLLLGILAAGLLGLSLLALVGMVGLLAGLQNAAQPAVEVVAAQPTALVLVLPGPAASAELVAMPGPSELAAVAAATLPTVAPTTQPAVGGAISTPSGEPQSPPQRPEQRVITYGELFRAVGEQTGIDWRLLAALAFRESRMDPLALGRDGDMGLMQILPATWDEFAPTAAAANPFDPRENVQVSAAYLVYLQDFMLQLKTNDLRWVLVAYNWGPERVRQLLTGGGRWEDVPALQQRYVADILYTAFGEWGGLAIRPAAVADGVS
ncbi:MAG: transglycosylase SLT domain-containing protein [Chloroflexi bacterium]|nr:transglycosylase SLT domain-containing protein [Chloroflexota bacterium]